MQHHVSINKNLIFSILLIILHLLILFYYSKFDISVQFLCEISTYRKSSIKPPWEAYLFQAHLRGGGLIFNLEKAMASVLYKDLGCRV